MELWRSPNLVTHACRPGKDYMEQLSKGLDPAYPETVCRGTPVDNRWKRVRQGGEVTCQACRTMGYPNVLRERV